MDRMSPGVRRNSVHTTEVAEPSRVLPPARKFFVATPETAAAVRERPRRGRLNGEGHRGRPAPMPRLRAAQLRVPRPGRARPPRRHDHGRPDRGRENLDQYAVNFLDYDDHVTAHPIAVRQRDQATLSSRWE